MAQKGGAGGAHRIFKAATNSMTQLTDVKQALHDSMEKDRKELKQIEEKMSKLQARSDFFKEEIATKRSQCNWIVKRTAEVIRFCKSTQGFMKAAHPNERAMRRLHQGKLPRPKTTASRTRLPKLSSKFEAKTSPSRKIDLSASQSADTFMTQRSAAHANTV